jgi:DNA-binding GntR family transcriptional regulator
MSTINAEDSVAGSHISTIRVGSVRDHVRRALEAAMVAGELKPGQMYSAPALSERFGVSATPVREAMLDLVKDGFVVAVRNRGFLVLEMSDEDLDEISQIRLLLEVPTTAQLAKLITTNVLDHLRTIADEIVAAAERGDLIDYLDSDRRFHVELISQAGNDRLTELVDRLRRQTRLFGLDDLVAAGRLVASAREHHALLDAMQARDTSLTRSVITSHIKHTRGLWVGRAEE